LPPSADPPGGPERTPDRFRLGERARARRERATRLGAPHLVPAALAVVAALLVWAAWGRISCGDARLAVASPETQVRAALARHDRARVPDVYGFRAGGTATLRELRYADVAVLAERGRAQVVAVVEAEGEVAWRDEQARVSYVGREAFAMTPCRIALWCADGDQFARLKGVLATLFRREDAFNGRDADGYARLVSDAYQGGKEALLARLRADLGGGAAARMRVLAWQIRVERDRATVGEDYEIQVGETAPRRLRARFELAREDDRWRIVSGL
jgi:hypothetical protein